MSSIVAYTVTQGTPEEIVFNIFQRINTGGIELNDQEIRQALYSGKGTDLIKVPAYISQRKKQEKRGKQRKTGFPLLYTMKDPTRYSPIPEITLLFSLNRKNTVIASDTSSATGSAHQTRLTFPNCASPNATGRSTTSCLASEVIIL